MAINQAFDKFEEIPLDGHKIHGAFILNTSKLHRWTMLRTWVNGSVSRDISNAASEDVTAIPRLNLPPDRFTTTLLVDPNARRNGHKLQDKYGAQVSTDVGKVGVLPDNVYFVYGIPRAKFAVIPTVTKRIKGDNSLKENTIKSAGDNNSDGDSLKDVTRQNPWL